MKKLLLFLFLTASCFGSGNLEVFDGAINVLSPDSSEIMQMRRTNTQNFLDWTTSSGDTTLFLIGGPVDLNLKGMTNVGNLTQVGNISGSDIDINAGTGDYTSTGSINVTSVDANSLTVNDLTPTRVVFVGAAKELVDDAAFTFITDTLLSPNVTASGLITTAALLLNLADDEQYKFQRDSVGELALSNIDTDAAATQFRIYPPTVSGASLFSLFSNATPAAGGFTNNVRLVLVQTPTEASIITRNSGSGVATSLVLGANGGSNITLKTTDGTVLFGGNLIIPNNGYIGSVTTTNAIQITGSGKVNFSGVVDITGRLTVSGSTDLGDSSADITCINGQYDLPILTGTTGFLVYQTGTDTQWGYVDPASLSVALAAAVTVADESSDETCFPAFFTAATGGLPIKTDADGLTYNSLTKSLGIGNDLTFTTGSITSASGTIDFGDELLKTTGSIGVGNSLFHTGDEDTLIFFANNTYFFQAGGFNFLKFQKAIVNICIFNEDGVDINVRMESANEDKLFFLDAALDVLRFGDADTNYTQISATGDLSFGGGGGLLYGNMDQNGGTFDVFLENVDQLYELDAATTNISAGPLNDVTFPGDHYLEVKTAGAYKIDWSLICQIDGLTGGSEHVEFEVLKNGNATGKGESHVTHKNTARDFPIASTTLLDLAVDDEISIGATARDSSGKTITIDHLEMTIFMVGGA